MPMLLIITIVLSALVALNFLLLAFSCNKTTKKVNASKIELTTSKKVLVTKQSETIQLAPTGS